MRIIIYGINYAPEPTGIGKYTGEMAEWLAARGHDVRVITAPPYYPHWKVYPGFKGSRYKTEELNGVKIYRCPIWIPKKLSGAKRLLHLLSFAATSMIPLIKLLKWKPEVVWVCAPSLACAPAGALFSKWVHAVSWLHIQDFEVDVAFDTGLLKGAVVKKIAYNVEAITLKSFDVTSSISTKMIEKVEQKGVPAYKTHRLPNWVDLTVIRPTSRNNALRAELGIEESSLVALFSGTFAAKQDLHILPKIAEHLKNTGNNFLLLLCGDGPVKQELLASASHLENVKFIPLQPKERLSELLGLADIHLLPQAADVADLVMPSKLTGMLASGRPIVTNAKANSEVANIVAQCGLVVPPGDVVQFAGALKKLLEKPHVRQAMGEKARYLAERDLEVNNILDRMVNRFQSELGLRRKG